MRPAQASRAESWLALTCSGFRMPCGTTVNVLERTMSGNGHPSPEQVRSKIDHPIVDGDGHWVEYDPVFSEKMRKVGGDLAADGFLAAMRVTKDSLEMPLAERMRRRV